VTHTNKCRWANHEISQEVAQGREHGNKRLSAKNVNIFYESLQEIHTYKTVTNLEHNMDGVHISLVGGGEYMCWL
jgi:hypothetical protein